MPALQERACFLDKHPSLVLHIQEELHLLVKALEEQTAHWIYCSTQQTWAASSVSLVVTTLKLRQNASGPF